MKKVKILGVIIGATAMILAWIFFGWKLVLIIILALWGNNLELRGRI